jgi:hypothetical protein
MKLGFYTVFRTDPRHYALADILVNSVRQSMPGVEIVHLTDEKSPIVPGVDASVRFANGPLLERRMQIYSSVDGEWLFLDTDTVVAKDVRHVFDDSAFDLAVADREWSLVKDHYKYTKGMTFNTGVIFSRSPKLYQLALEIWRHYPAEKQAHWWSEQWAFAEAVYSGKFAVKVLPGMIYNRPPHTRDEDVSDAAILHYKGPTRKAWMMQRRQAVSV